MKNGLLNKSRRKKKKGRTQRLFPGGRDNGWGRPTGNSKITQIGLLLLHWGGSPKVDPLLRPTLKTVGAKKVNLAMQKENVRRGRKREKTGR